MSDEKQATPYGTLIEQIMNPNIAKSEREWAASREIESLRARIDALMLEYCPDEMSAEQKAEWGKNQRIAELERPAWCGSLENWWNQATDEQKKLAYQQSISADEWKAKHIRDIEARPTKTTQEFFWLIEGHDGVKPVYSTGEEIVNEWQWTYDSHKALKFPSKISAESMLWGTSMSSRDKNGGHLKGYIKVVEHGFITEQAAPAEVDSKSRLKGKSFKDWETDYIARHHLKPTAMQAYYAAAGQAAVILEGMVHVTTACSIVELQRRKVLANKNDPSYTEHFAEIIGQLIEAAKGEKP